MTRGLWITATIQFLVIIAACSAAQAQDQLTLKQAESAAIQNHPRLKVAQLTAQASAQTATAARSSLMPSLFSNFTGATALDDSRIAAGGLNNPVIYDRVATGLNASQLITDFGRTSHLVESANLHAKSQEMLSEATKEQLILDVDRAYFGVLRAQAVLRVATRTVEARNVVLDQVTELARNKLKSDLDLSFARVNVADAELFRLNSQNELRAAYADLALAMGEGTVRQYRLVDEPMPGTLPLTPDELIKEALSSRADMSALQLERDSAATFSKAERSLRYPSINAILSLGVIPERSAPLTNRYGALGFNISVPIFNGKLYNARQKEAEIKASASEERLKELSNSISRDVTVAWLRANTAFERIALTGQLLDQSAQTVELAQARYDLGLSSIVELSQAQLGETAAEIANTNSKYDYQLQRAVLDYQIGISH